MKKKRIISLILQLFLLIPLRQYSITILYTLIPYLSFCSVIGFLSITLFIIPISQSARLVLTFVLFFFLLIPVCVQVSAGHSRLSTCRYFDKNQRRRVM